MLKDKIKELIRPVSSDPYNIDLCNSSYNEAIGDVLKILEREESSKMESENANLTVENEVLKRDVQNLERTLEEGREKLEDLKAGNNILLAELEIAQSKISEYEAGKAVILTAERYAQLEKIEIDGVVSAYELRAEARKETARAIYALMTEEYEIYIPTEIAKEIVKRFGVEVEE